MNKKIIEFITIVILIVLVIILTKACENSCIKNGGTVVTDKLGIYDKCIYEKEKK